MLVAVISANILCLLLLQNVQPDSKVVGKLNLEKSTTADVFKWFGLDANSQSFVGHAMALQNSDDYLNQFVFRLFLPTHT